MSYTIWPQEMATVFSRTGVERDQLDRSLAAAGHAVGEAQAAASAAAPVAAALGEFLAAHDQLAQQMLDRVASALLNGDLAVEAYVHADLAMAEQHARAAAAVLPPGTPRAASPDLANPLPSGPIGG
jgi:Family of unknown function (DUF6507)